MNEIKKIPVISMPILESEPPTGPIEYGITYIVLPFMQPGNLLSISAFMSSNDIQLPSWVHLRFFRLVSFPTCLKPLRGVGMVSFTSAVHMTVRDSTRATSLGSVKLSQLQIIQILEIIFFKLKQIFIRPDALVVI